MLELDPLRPSQMQQDIQFASVSQEVRERFYKPVGDSLSSPWYCSMLFSAENVLATVRLTDVLSLPIAGEALAIAALSASAVAQNAQAPINTPTELEAALLACWVPPPLEQSRPGMQITVLMSFKRNGELFEQPRIVFQSREASDTQRSSYRDAVAQMLKRCASLPFTAALGNIVAGQPFTMTFVDDREQNP